MKKLYFGLFGVVLVIALTAFLVNNDTVDDVYTYYGIDGLNVEDKVIALDQQSLDGSIISAGILETELIINTENSENKYDIPEGKFYLSFAPYINTTHPCHNHNLVTCQSELANETMNVMIEDDSGDVYLDDEITLYDNGFYGIWLPSSADYSITVEYQDKTVTADFSTYEDSGTCLTEPLKLT